MQIWMSTCKLLRDPLYDQELCKIVGGVRMLVSVFVKQLPLPLTQPDNACRPVQPKYGSVWLTIAAILLANLGGLCCMSLASVYYGEGNALGQFSKGKDKKFFSWIVRVSLRTFLPDTVRLCK